LYTRITAADQTTRFERETEVDIICERDIFYV